MRKVNRSNVTYPKNLKSLTETQKKHLDNYSKISSSVYGHNDVKQSLKELYYDKCYICECDVSNGFVVEHYLPKKHFPKFGYKWENLHKSCTSCNLAKEANDFKVIDKDKKILDILLLDPSSDSYNINDYIYFNINSEVLIKKNAPSDKIKEKAKQTVKHLNSSDIKCKRDNTIISFLHSCIQCFDSYKDRLIELEKIFNEKKESYKKKDEDTHILNKLENIEKLYLSDSSEYSTSTRVHLFSIFRLNYNQIKNIIINLKNELNP